MGKKIKGFLSKEELAALKGGDLRSGVATLGLYLLILGSFVALSLATGLPLPARAGVAIFAFLVIGWCQFSLSNGLHEALHRNFFNRGSDLPADLLLAYPLCVKTSRYREVHLSHHQHLGDPMLDPDFITYTTFPRSRLGFLARLGRYGSGLPAVLQFLRQSSAGPKAPRSPRDLRPLLGIAAYQGGLLLLLSLALGPAYYFFFWLAPLVTIGKLLSSCRALCEHGSPERPFVVRTITGRPWDELSLGSYGFHYHGEHHLLPSVPYAHLRELHALHLAARHDPAAEVDGRFEHYPGGYLGLLWCWFRQLPWRAPAAP